MRFTAFMKSLISTKGSDDSKNFTLILSALISFIAGLVICFSIVFDVVSNGYIKSDLEEVGIFMLSIGGYMAGGSISKVFGDKYEGRTARYRDYLDYEAEMEDKDGDVSERAERARRRRKERKKARDIEMRPEMPSDDVDVLGE